MSYPPKKKPSARCPLNGCSVPITGEHILCEKHWRLVPKALRITFLRERREDRGAGGVGNDSLTMATIACLEAAESAMSEGA